MKQKRRGLFTIDSFSDDAKALRREFDDRFADPHGADGKRFIWDYWHVPGQYTTLRTPSYHFFSSKLYSQFHNQLVWWGRRHLGCHDVSPPWLSCYVDGCRQELHGDLPHGPWAFVFSLTPWRQRKFRGGETILLRENILNHWSHLEHHQGLEDEAIFDRVPALFNRLTIFDPRIPHGVSRVEGVNDVRDGRLVIHGWFVQPRPFIEGPLATRDLQSVIDDLSGSLSDLFAQGLALHGMVSVRLKVLASGKVQKVEVLSNSLRHPFADQVVERAALKHIVGFLSNSSFRKSRGVSLVTLPLVFAPGG